MNINDFQDFPIYARTAYAIMCCERYVAAVHPELDFRPVAELMWHIISGSVQFDDAAYKFLNIAPDVLFGEDTDTYQSYCSEYRYISEEEYHFFRHFLHNYKDDAALCSLMHSVYDIAIYYAYDSVIEPNATKTLTFLHNTLDIMKQHQIKLPYLELIEDYSISRISYEVWKKRGWLGADIQPRGLSIYLKPESIGIEEFYFYPIYARTAYAIMCCEKYVSTVHPEFDFRPVSEFMWNVIDGSMYLDDGAYRFARIFPRYLFEEECETLEEYCDGEYPYITEEEYHLFLKLFDKYRDDTTLDELMNNVYYTAMSYIYTSAPPHVPNALPPLRKTLDIMERFQIELPDLNLLAQYSVLEMNPEIFEKCGWWGEKIQPQGLSIYIS